MTKEQQFKIYRAADEALKLLGGTLEPHEVIGAIATMMAMEIGLRHVPEDAFAYLDKTSRALLPIVVEEIARRTAAGTA